MARTPLLALMIACQSPPARPQEGMLPVEGGRIWYEVIGTGRGIPLIVLHGGPGGTDQYLSALQALGDDRPVVLYDQLGSGRSDRISDTSLMHADRYARELDSLRRYLRFARVNLYGHSWGGALALEYLRSQSSSVASVILASPLVRTADWLADAWQRIAALPDPIRRAITEHEKAGTTDAPEYKAAVDVYYRQYVYHAPPPYPANVDSSDAGLNLPVSDQMWGRAEFSPSGNLRDFDGTEVLKGLPIPVLFTAGRFDEVVSTTLERYAAMTLHGQVAIFEQSGHFWMVTEPTAYIARIRRFLRDADRP